MDRMSPQDASFLYIENDVNHMHIAAVAIFDGPPPSQDEIEELIASKLHLVPRYRQLARFVPLDLARPVWADDPHFDLRYHVRHSALPAPGTAEQLRTLVGRVMSQHLDRAKPLWEVWVVEGLEGERWAMLSKTHHCMVDGVAGADLLAVILDGSADAPRPVAPAWRPRKMPTPTGLLVDAVRGTLTSPFAAARAVSGALSHPRRLLREIADVGDGLRTFGFSDKLPESALNGPIGPHRRWRQTRMSISDIRKIRSVHGGTVNDVVLAVVTHGFRTLLLARGEPVLRRVVRTLIPVSVRREDEKGVANNRVSAMFAELPVGEEDPLASLSQLREQMEGLKEHHQPVAAETLSALSGFAPPALLALGSRFVADLEQSALQTVVTNVPGPQQRLYAAGRAMTEVYPYVPLFGNVRIAVAIFSYAGEIAFGVTCDASAVKDVDVFIDGLEEGAARLLHAC